MDESKQDKMSKFNAQFQRSAASPLAELREPRLELDGGAILDKYVQGGDAASMSGAEFYAMVGHIKRQHGAKGEALETELMKISRQKDKKLRLIDWVGQHVAAPTATAPPAAPPAVAGTPVMPRLNLGGAAAAAQEEAPQCRPSTARPAYSGHGALAGGQMAELFGATTPQKEPPLTARPATASAAGGAPADMSVTFASYCSGRDHLKMSGAEYHSLVAWLKARGHPDLEDMLMKVRLLGEKKYHLVKYMKEKCADLLAGVGAPTAMAAMAAPPPAFVGGAQVLEVHPPPMMPMPAVAAAAPPPPAAMMPALPAQPLAAAPPTAPTNAAALQGIATLEATIQRLEESFSFAVECMQTDMAAAREQLRQLRGVVQQSQ